VPNTAAYFLGSNSTTYTKGDVVAHQGGQLIVKGASSSPAIVGVVLKTATMSSTNQTVAKVYPSYYDLSQKDTTWLMGTWTDMAETTSVGLFMTIQSDGTTAIQQVDPTEAVTTGNKELVCLEVDPQAEGGTGSGSGLRQGLFRFVKVFGDSDLYA
jgi:hypothetical protein